MRTLVQNFRYALRQLRKSPGFAITAVLTLALGIGATTAVFSLFDQVMLRMLPVHNPQQLVRLHWSGGFSGTMYAFGGDDGNYYSYPEYKELRDRNPVFSGILAAAQTEFGVSWDNQSTIEDAEMVSGNYFQVLGLKPAAGRLFTAADETAKNANPVVVLSYDNWKTNFARSRSVIGQALLINGHPFTIVGVAPEGFLSAIGGYRPRVFVPVTMADEAMPWTAQQHPLTNHLDIWLTIVARLKPGMTIAKAQAGLAPLWHTMRSDEFNLSPNPSPRFRQLFVARAHMTVLDDSRGFTPERMDLKLPLILLLSMAGLLTVMCVLNLATLLLLRSTARLREMCMRYALGANFRDMVSLLLTEGALLGLCGAVLGLMITPVLTTSLVWLMTHSNPSAEPYSSSVDGHVLLFTAVLAAAATLLFSIAPVFHFLRPDIVNGLRQNAGTSSRQSQRVRKTIVGVQIAFSMLLLGTAGMFVQTLHHLRGQNVGFDTTHLATFGLDPTVAGYTEAQTPALVRSALQTLRQLPGVTAAAATTDQILANEMNVEGFTIRGYKPQPGENLVFENPWITPGFFKTLHQPLLAGRDFTAADGASAPQVAIVNLAFAKKFFGSPQNAMGHAINDGGKQDSTIVGVVGNIKHYNLRSKMKPEVYQPYWQMPNPVGVQIYIHTRGAPDGMEPLIREAIHRMNPTLVVDGLRTMQSQVVLSAADTQALATLALGFSILALLLAGIGLYGALSYSTQSRTREIGVRLALGSPRASIVALVTVEMIWVAAIASVIAIPATIALARLFRSQLYGVSTFAPWSLAAALMITLLALVLASALPALRAASVDPVDVLKKE